MATLGETDIRDELRERRGKLEAAIATGGVEAARLEHLLEEVDEALGRLDGGAYGMCDVCHDPIEIERLMGDPLIRTCLDHLTGDERRALEQDLDLASRVQSRLLPRQDLSHAGWQAAYHYDPAGPVSGDYCDLVTSERDSDGLFFLLGDVSGKGVAASMLMTGLRATVRTLIGPDLPVSGLVERVNHLFCEGIAASHFATLVCGRASSSGRVEICNAGHPPPLVARGGTIESLAATGLPVGLFCASPYAATEVRLAPGDLLLLYTDGVSEARDRSGAEYGTERLTRVLRDQHARSPRDLLRACLGDLATFRGGAPKADDMSLMILKRS